MQFTERIPWIDECKGFILLLVCLFHLEQSFANIQMGMLHCSAFRMSAFFYLSGMLFSNRRFPRFLEYLKHKTKVLLVPYILLSLLFLAMDPVLYHFAKFFPLSPKMSILGIHPDIQNVWQYLGWNLAKIFVAGKSSVGAGPLWFVFNLYGVSLLFFAAHKITSGKKMPLLLLAALGMAGGWLSNRYAIHLPWGIERILTTFFFFAMGYISKGFIFTLGNAKIFLLVASALLFAVLYAFFETPDPNFSIMNNALGKNFLSFLFSSLTGTWGILSLFLLANRFPKVFCFSLFQGILRNISRNGMIILAVHWWILLVLRIVFKAELDKPELAYISIPIVIIGVILAIPLFRCKLYRLISKEKISAKESLSIH